MKKTLIIFLAALLFASCKKEQPEMTVLNAGCDCAEEVSAGFSLEEVSGYNSVFEERTETDSTFISPTVFFSANEANADYTWYLGSEVINEKSFYRFFSGIANQNIKVTLVVKKQTNAICFPDDDGYDSVVKYFYVTDKTADSAFLKPFPSLEGNYRVKETNGIDSVDISVELYDAGLMGGSKVEISIPDGNFVVPMQSQTTVTTINYRQIWFEVMYYYVSLQHFINGGVEIYFTPKIPEQNQSYYYKGRKLI